MFRQYHLGCLSLFSYLVGEETTGRAVVVDPQRDIDDTLLLATWAGPTCSHRRAGARGRPAAAHVQRVVL